MSKVIEQDDITVFDADMQAKITEMYKHSGENFGFGA